MRKTLLLSPLTLLLVVTAFTHVNSPTRPAQQEAQVAAGTEFVTFNVIVTDRNGHYVE